MAQEQFKCGECKTKFTVEWDEDEVIDFVDAEYCPMCGYELAEEYQDDCRYADEIE